MGTGFASAAPDRAVEVNVGFGAESGKRAALSKADTVVREFDRIDVVTRRLPKQAVDALGARADVRFVEENGIMRKLGEVKWSVELVAAVAKAAGYSNGRQRLKDTAENIGLSSNEQGAGLLDVAAAVNLDSGDDY